MNKIYRKLYSSIKDNPEAVNCLLTQKRKTFHNHQKIKGLERELSEQKEFLGIVAHDIRSPVAAIEGLTSLFKEDLSEEEKILYLMYLSKKAIQIKETSGLISLTGKSLKYYQANSTPINFNKRISDYYFDQEILKKEGIELKINSLELFPLMPESIANFLVMNTMGDTSKHALPNTSINVEIKKEGDHFKYSTSNKYNPNFRRDISGENNGKGIPFMKYIVEQIYQGKVSITDQDGIYKKEISIPLKNLQPPKE